MKLVVAVILPSQKEFGILLGSYIMDLGNFLSLYISIIAISSHLCIMVDGVIVKQVVRLVVH